jgi:hypothetical protein
MAEIEDLTLHYLRRFDEKLDRISEDVREIKGGSVFLNNSMPRFPNVSIGLRRASIALKAGLIWSARTDHQAARKRRMASSHSNR